MCWRWLIKILMIDDRVYDDGGSDYDDHEW